MTDRAVLGRHPGVAGDCLAHRGHDVAAMFGGGGKVAVERQVRPPRRQPRPRPPQCVDAVLRGRVVPAIPGTSPAQLPGPGEGLGQVPLVKNLGLQQCVSMAARASYSVWVTVRDQVFFTVVHSVA